MLSVVFVMFFGYFNSERLLGQIFDNLLTVGFITGGGLLNILLKIFTEAFESAQYRIIRQFYQFGHYFTVVFKSGFKIVGKLLGSLS